MYCFLHIYTKKVENIVRKCTLNQIIIPTLNMDGILESSLPFVSHLARVSSLSRLPLTGQIDIKVCMGHMLKLILVAVQYQFLEGGYS